MSSEGNNLWATLLRKYSSNQIVQNLPTRKNWILVSSIIILLLLIEAINLYKKCYEYPKNSSNNLDKNMQSFFRNTLNQSINNFNLYAKNAVMQNKLVYDFINNLTTLNYYGQWTNLYYKENNFESGSGIVEIEFKKNKNNFFSNIYANSSNIRLIFLLKDDKYVDKYIKGSVIISLNSSFSNQLHSIIYDENNTNNSIIIYNEDSLVEFISCGFLVDCVKYVFKNITIKIQFIKKVEILHDRFKARFVSIFSKVNLNFYDSKSNFSLDIKSGIYYNKNLSVRIRNYSFILTAVSIIELFFLINNLSVIQRSVRKCFGMSLFTIGASVIIKCLICMFHFYLSVTNTDKDIICYYAIPAILHFIIISYFEVRTLYYVFKGKHYELFETDIKKFKMKLYVVMFFFYLSIFLYLALSKVLVTNYSSVYFLLSSVWMFQIIHSIFYGIRPPMSEGYIISCTVYNLLLPIYVKAYQNNIFNFKPNFKEIAFLIVTVLFEVFILLLQKNYGSRCLIPLIFKNYSYNYYYDDLKDRGYTKNLICAICLCNINPKEDQEKVGNINDNNNNNDNSINISSNLNLNINLNINQIKQNENIDANNNNISWKKYFCLNVNLKETKICISYIYYSDKLKDFIGSVIKSISKKPFMITPCNHIFHSKCFEKWLEVKTECPYCKQQLPQLE